MRKNDTIKKVGINTEYITLGQLLKFADIVDGGGAAKFYLQTNEVLVNGEPDNRRGRKLRPGDVIELNEGRFEIVEK